MTPSKYIAKLPPSEPVFILRAQDKFAPAIVDLWANMLEAERGLNNKQVRKVYDAKALAQTMRGWQAVNTSKTPD